MSTDSFRTVRLGISLVLYGLLLLLLFIVLAIISAMSAVLTGSAAAAAVFFIIAVVTVAVRIAASVLGLVGKILCLAVPEETGAKGFVYAAVTLEVIVALVSMSEFFVEVPPILALATQLFAVTALVLFLVFLRQLAFYLHQPALAERAASVLRIGVGMVFTIVLGIVGVLVFPPLSLIIIVTLILALIGVILYLFLLSGLRRALNSS